MPVNMLRKLNHNQEIWFKYSCFPFGFDLYRAKFESSLPGFPIKMVFGKQFVDLRFFKWQFLINKLTKPQLSRLQKSRQQENNNNNNDFQNPTFGF